MRSGYSAKQSLPPDATPPTQSGVPPLYGRLQQLQADADRVKPLGYHEITTCHRCQYESLGSANFCNHCGTQLRERCSSCCQKLEMAPAGYDPLWDESRKP
jgi:hypothetical protein